MTVDATGPAVRRFPLVARPRPTSGPLPVRVADLSARAEAADRDNDLAGASSVFNLAALIASDCGLPDLARQWCHDHAALHLRALPRGAQVARHALEPLVNLARLHIRGGNGEQAFRLLDSLYRAVASRTSAVIDGIDVPGDLTATDADHRQLRQWLWSVHLSDGTRALTSLGRWQGAHRHVLLHRGVGDLMLDGRQTAVIAQATGGDVPAAVTLIDTTLPGEPWQAAVTACLRVLCTSGSTPASEHVDTMFGLYKEVVRTPATAPFHTRLGLCMIDAAGGVDHRDARAVALGLIEHAMADRDVITIRDVMAHDGCVSRLRPDQARDLVAALDASELGRGSIPSALYVALTSALSTSAAVLGRLLDSTDRT
ncbi:hypothetical protein [Catellatospora sp. NPDC049609]|uniref:hypothetical protein n=1 Tax=Catellatospora sp. NPDC049609 TaxID=3155505 RepID=UPI00341C35B5